MVVVVVGNGASCCEKSCSCSLCSNLCCARMAVRGKRNDNDDDAGERPNEFLEKGPMVKADTATVGSSTGIHPTTTTRTRRIRRAGSSPKRRLVVGVVAPIVGRWWLLVVVMNRMEFPVEDRWLGRLLLLLRLLESVVAVVKDCSVSNRCCCCCGCCGWSMFCLLDLLFER